MVLFPMALTTERQTYLLKLRRHGKSVTEIADMLDITPSAVGSALKGAYSKLHMEHEAIEARDLELSRLDEMQDSFYEVATAGDPKAAEVVFKAMDRRAKLLGLDAPEKKQVETAFTIGWLDDDKPTTVDAHPDVPGSGDSGDHADPTAREKKRIAEGAAKLTAVSEID
jgi:DNA-binding CsgD family transcriptional regulator